MPRSYYIQTQLFNKILDHLRNIFIKVKIEITLNSF